MARENQQIQITTLQPKTLEDYNRNIGHVQRGVKVLDLRHLPKNVIVTDDEISKIIERFPNLLALYLRGSTISDEGFNAVATQLNKLQILTLEDCHDITNTSIKNFWNSAVRFVIMVACKQIDREIFDKFQKRVLTHGAAMPYLSEEIVRDPESIDSILQILQILTKEDGGIAKLQERMQNTARADLHAIQQGGSILQKLFNCCRQPAPGQHVPTILAEIYPAICKEILLDYKELVQERQQNGCIERKDIFYQEPEIRTLGEHKQPPMRAGSGSNTNVLAVREEKNLTIRR